MNYNSKQHLIDNIKAIRIAFMLEKNNTKATVSDIEILKRYSGFGGLKCILYNCENDSDVNKWPKYEQEFFPYVRQLYTLIKNFSKDEIAFQEYVISLRNSVLTAYYTPSLIVKTIVENTTNVGQSLKVLEPSAGHGEFIAALKNSNSHAEIYAYEKDLITGKILSLLYPSERILTKPFEEISDNRLNYFDIVTSNIPFGDFKIFDKKYSSASDSIKKYSTQSIHNYFFIKGLDCLKEGGLLIYITSQYFMDSTSNERIRKYLMENSNLVSAIRFPNNLFSEYANTEAGSDLIILQKNSNKSTLTDLEKKFIQSQISPEQININSLFDSPENIIASSVYKSTDQYGKPGYKYFQTGGVVEIANNLKGILSAEFPKYFNEKLFSAHSISKNNIFPASGKKKEISDSQIPKLSNIIQSTPQETLIPESDKSETKQAPIILSLFDIYDQQNQNLIVRSSDPPLPQTKQQHHRRRKSKNKNEELPELPNLFTFYTNKDGESIKQNFEKRIFRGKFLPFYKAGTLIKCNKQIGYLSEEDGMLFFKPLRANFYIYDVLAQYIVIRNLYQQLTDYENNKREEDTKTRLSLNKAYDKFVHDFGDMNSKWNVKVILMDIWGQDTLTLESFKDGIKLKAEIFENPVAFTQIIVEKTNNINEALAASLNYFGKVNLPYIIKAMGKPEDIIIEELKGKVYYNPIRNEYETSERFLSGNVLDKIESIEELLKIYPKNITLTDCLTALRTVAPPQVNFDEIDLNFGERWIPHEIFSRYASELFGTEIKIRYYPETDTFTVSAEDENHINITEKYAVHASQKYNGLKLLKNALVNTIPFITKTIVADGVDVKVPDSDNIQLAGSKIEDMRTGFTNWLQNQTEQFKNSLTNLYNRIFNGIVRSHYDGSKLTFPGLHLKNLGINSLYNSQKDCIWMLLQNIGGIVDHEVGLGKTLIMCVASYEMKRLGLINKPMIIALPANIDDIANFYQLAYPKAKLLYCGKEDFTTDKRIRVFREIKNNNWDLVLLTHDQFAKIPQSLSIQKLIIQEELEGCALNLSLMERDGERTSSRLFKGLARRIENLKCKIKNLTNRISSHYDDVADFESMNIDHLFVDECQQFKNLTYTSRHDRVAGLGNQLGSQRALNLLHAVRTIQNRFNSDLCATFLSGTIISNSLIELYTWHRYLRPRALKRQGIGCVDAWLATFAVKSYNYEFGVTNEIILKERYREFIKIPELVAFHYQITDYRTAKDINLDRPLANVVLITTELTLQQQIFNKQLISFARTGDAKCLGRPPLNEKERKAKMLIATDYSRKMALDMRLVNPIKYLDETDNKLSACAKQIAEMYYQYDSVKGTQLVFSDLGTFKPESPYSWNVYMELKRKLVEDYFLPASEIRFVQEFISEKEKAFYKEEFNKGAIRILMGSTIKLGTGNNVQRNIIAIHDLDIPWTHKDLTQRHGRGIRTGNEIAKYHANNTVNIFIYATKNSLDIYRFTLLQNKELFANQVRAGQCAARRIDEGTIDKENGCSYAEYIAILSGNTDLLDKAKLEKEIAALEREKYAFHRNQRSGKYRLNDLQRELEVTNSRIDSVSVDYTEFKRQLKLNEKGKPILELQLKKFDSQDPKLLGQELKRINSKLNTHGDYIEIGKIYNFPILVLTTQRSITADTLLNVNKFMIKGGNGALYIHNYGNLPSDPILAATSFLKAFESLPEILKDLKEKKEKIEKDLPVLDQIVNESWKKEGKLKKLKEKLSEIQRKINFSLQQLDKVEPEPLPVLKTDTPEQVVYTNINSAIKLLPPSNQGNSIKNKIGGKSK